VAKRPRAASASSRTSKELRRLGLAVRQARTRRGWTLETAAERMDIDTTHLAKIEAGNINLTVSTLVRVAHGLGVDVGELFVR
jgi:transcriptional regulator with XRE-family HTH domain